MKKANLIFGTTLLLFAFIFTAQYAIANTGEDENFFFSWISWSKDSSGDGEFETLGHLRSYDDSDLDTTFDVQCDWSSDGQAWDDCQPAKEQSIPKSAVTTWTGRRTPLTGFFTDPVGGIDVSQHTNIHLKLTNEGTDPDEVINRAMGMPAANISKPTFHSLSTITSSDIPDSSSSSAPSGESFYLRATTQFTNVYNTQGQHGHSYKLSFWHSEDAETAEKIEDALVDFRYGISNASSNRKANVHMSAFDWIGCNAAFKKKNEDKMILRVFARAFAPGQQQGETEWVAHKVVDADVTDYCTVEEEPCFVPVIACEPYCEPDDTTCENNCASPGAYCPDSCEIDEEEYGDCSSSSSSSSSGYCGDGTLDEGEECDDGNNDNGDGCDEFCYEE